MSTYKLRPFLSRSVFITNLKSKSPPKILDEPVQLKSWSPRTSKKLRWIIIGSINIVNGNINNLKSTISARISNVVREIKRMITKNYKYHKNLFDHDKNSFCPHSWVHVLSLNWWMWLLNKGVTLVMQPIQNLFTLSYSNEARRHSKYKFSMSRRETKEKKSPYYQRYYY